MFTIPPSVPFLPTLIRALREGRLVDGFAPGPLDFADVTIFLPTRRACRLARDTFLEVLGVDAAVLPRLVPIGDIDEDELVFADMATGNVAADALALLPALGGLERRFLLARLVLKWVEGIAPSAGETPLVMRHPAAALALADDLARLMDDMTTREVPWQRLDELVPDEHDRYWQLTLRFLSIAREMWPRILAERGAIEPAMRRDRLIAAEAARLASRPDKPVIAAGSTGSMPATAKLLATIAGLPHGAVVLPGLDTELDEESWDAIGGVRPGPVTLPAPGHPQFAMHALLARIGVKRCDVGIVAAPQTHGRETLVSEALRPAAATDKWRTRLDELGAAVGGALAGVTVIEAANAEEEALAVAVALREVQSEPGRTAALVTPDRALARRVAVTLRRWNIMADDTGGDALADTAAGVFCRLVAEAAVEGLAPARLLALLKHPLARFGADEVRHGRGVAALERAILRGPRPRPGSSGLIAALAGFRGELAKLKRGETSDIHHSEPRASLDATELDEAQALLQRIATALEPLQSAAALSGLQDFAGLAARHWEAVMRAGADESAEIFAGPDGAALAAAFNEIVEKIESFPVSLEDYPELFVAAIADLVVRHAPLDPPPQAGQGREGANRISIYGPLEARLTRADRVVVGGLVEGVWPPDPRADPWLSRPMRHVLGLDLPERRIGLAAHDFVQMLGAREVFLTYPAKRGGAPMVASRFVQRLAAVAGAALWQEALARGERYRELCRRLDAPAAPPRPISRPAPRPPLAVRPTSLSVTDIEHWLRDPYTIYAKHILKLPRLDPVDDKPGAAERGSIIHRAIGDFAKAYADALPDESYRVLLHIGERHFAPLKDFPEARAFWWPRYQRIARWFADFEIKRRAGIAAAHAEVHGELSIEAANRVFRLVGRADRIERLGDGRYAILDFKTGSPPTSPQVQAGVAPQLTLEAAMLRNGGFPGLAPGGSIGELMYVKLNGGTPAGEEFVVKLKGRSLDSAADEALERLTSLVNSFEDESTPYRALVLSMWKERYGAYDDLSRVKEWSLSGEEEGEDT